MSTHADRVAALLRAWYWLLGPNAEVTAGDLLRYASGPKARTDSKRAALREALEGVFSNRRVSPIKLGIWLRQHRDIEANGLRLHGDYDTGAKLWHWSVYPPPSDAELEAENDALVRRMRERRDSDLAASSPSKRVAALERYSDPAGIISPAVRREMDKAQERRARREPPTERVREALAPLRDEAKPEQRDPDAQSCIYVSPSVGHFSIESFAERRCRDFIALGFRASLDYLGEIRTAIRIEGATLAAVRPHAERFVLVAREVNAAPQPSKLTVPNAAGDYSTERFLAHGTRDTAEEWKRQREATLRRGWSTVGLPIGGEPMSAAEIEARRILSGRK